MKYRGILKFLFVAAVLLVAGFFASFFAGGRNLNAPQKKFDARTAVFSLFGGYRGFIADFSWLKAYMAWEKSDLSKCLSNIELAVSLDPENITFWNLGAGIIAYDTPHWIFDGRNTTPMLQKVVRERQGRLALEFLDRGLKAVPHSRRLKLDKALIYEKVFNDKLAALECYKAACDATAPIYVVRDYARALEDCGRDAEALRLLEERADFFDKSHPSYDFYFEHINYLKNKLKSEKNMLAL